MPDLIHTMLLGMLDHLQRWILRFIMMEGGLEKYKAMCLSVPAYHDCKPTNKSCDHVSQRNGKEMDEMTGYLLGVVTQSVRGGSPTERGILN
jgi:hypothetical protein